MNIADYRELNNVLATTGSGVSCFSLATSLQSSRLAQIVFGPFPTGVSPVDNATFITGDTTVGIFLDIKPLRKYIACLSVLDSGSVGRYGNTSVRIPQALKITSSRLSDYQGILDECASSDECGLMMAGCAGSQGSNPSISQQGKGYNFVENSFRVPAYSGDKGGPWIPKGWLFLDSNNGTPGTAPLFASTVRGLESFEGTLIQTQRIVGQQSSLQERENNTHCQSTVMLNTFKPPTLPTPDPQPSFQNSCQDYWSYQFHPNLSDWNRADGYRESEVDIFVPQTEDASPAWGPYMHCVPDSGFVDAFRQAVVGVYATQYCAKNVHLIDKDASPCCNLTRSKMIALAMAEKYNASPDAPRKIEAWVWDVVDPAGRWSPPDDPTRGRLNITKIS